MSALYTLEDLGSELKLSRSTLLRAIARGDLRVVRIGRSVRVTADEVARYVQERVAESQPA